MISEKVNKITTYDWRYRMNKLFENWRRYLTEAYESSYHLSNAPEGKEQNLNNLLNSFNMLLSDPSPQQLEDAYNQFMASIGDEGLFRRKASEWMNSNEGKEGFLDAEGILLDKIMELGQ